MDSLLSTNCFPYTNTRVNNYPQTINLKGLNPLLTTCFNIFFFLGSSVYGWLYHFF